MIAQLTRSIRKAHIIGVSTTLLLIGMSAFFIAFRGQVWTHTIPVLTELPPEQHFTDEQASMWVNLDEELERRRAKLHIKRNEIQSHVERLSTWLRTTEHPLDAISGENHSTSESALSESTSDSITLANRATRHSAKIPVKDAARNVGAEPSSLRRRIHNIAMQVGIVVSRLELDESIEIPRGNKKDAKQSKTNDSKEIASAENVVPHPLGWQRIELQLEGTYTQCCQFLQQLGHQEPNRCLRMQWHRDETRARSSDSEPSQLALRLELAVPVAGKGTLAAEILGAESIERGNQEASEEAI